jgi:death-on-curing family protein
MKQLELLSLENLLDINEQIKEDAKRDHRIEYSGSEDVQIYKLRRLIGLTPNRNLLEIAAYYLKNIILLQAFPDGNHRTALYAVELFLKKNGYCINYTPEEAYEFRKELYGRRLREYKTYEERSASILNEADNQVFLFCLEFVRIHSELT